MVNMTEIIFLSIVIPIMGIIATIGGLRIIQKRNIRKVKEKLNNKNYIEGKVTKKEHKEYGVGEHEYFVEIDNLYRLKVKSLNYYNALTIYQPCKVVDLNGTIVYIEGFTNLEGRNLFSFLNE